MPTTIQKVVVTYRRLCYYAECLWLSATTIYSSDGELPLRETRATWPWCRLLGHTTAPSQSVPRQFLARQSRHSSTVPGLALAGTGRVSASPLTSVFISFR